MSESASFAEETEIDGYEVAVSGGWEDYPIDELAIRDERRSAMDIVRRINGKRIILDPDFQRDFVWDHHKQSRLIESILMRIPLPVFYVAEDAQGRLIVVDGLQRLTTFQRFFEGQLRLDLPDREELHGKTFEDLDIRLQNRVEDCQLLFYIIDHAVPERARLDIFERVNGGEVLTRQQMRNAIYNGRATQFLKQEAQTDLFRKATGGSLNYKKMQDREFINRFCAFTLIPISTYKGDIDAWLAQALLLMNKMADEQFEDLRTLFHRTLRNNLTLFGRHAFRKHEHPSQSRTRLNAALFDVMSTRLATVDESMVDEHADELRRAFYELLQVPQFVKSITYSTNSPREVRNRFGLAYAKLDEILDD